MQTAMLRWHPAGHRVYCMNNVIRFYRNRYSILVYYKLFKNHQITIEIDGDKYMTENEFILSREAVFLGQPLLECAICIKISFFKYKKANLDLSKQRRLLYINLKSRKSKSG